jgi:hypothetical protein
LAAAAVALDSRPPRPALAVWTRRLPLSRPAGHRLFIRFEDGVEGEIDFETLISFHGVFEPLKDPKEVAKVKVDRSWARSVGRAAPTLILTCSMRR